jgi:hypothetical protein
MLEARWVPSSYVVTNLNDSGSGSLRQAILDAETLGGASTITFTSTLSGTINLTTVGDAGDGTGTHSSLGPAALEITSGTSITITGDANGITLARGGASNMRLFNVVSGATLTLNSLTLTGGSVVGGAGGTHSGHGGGGGGSAGLGGAIFNEGGTVNLVQATLNGNSATGGAGGAGGGHDAGGGGGGLAAAGSAGTNAVGGTGGGPNGGLAGLAGGFGGGGGGGSGNGGSAPGGAGGAGGFGGGGAGGGRGTSGGAGAAGGFGGGGGGGGFSSGTAGAAGAAGFGGGAGAANAGDGGGGAGLGGAIFNDGGTLSITNSTLTGNTAAGGTGAGAGQGLGGAVFNRNGTLTILSSTISSNTAADGGQGVYVLGDGAAATTSISDTIIGQSGTPTVTDFVGTTNSGGSVTTSGSADIIRYSSGFSGTILSTADPLLGSLASNGGPTKTMALQFGSPAVDTGSVTAASGLTTDQRGTGYPRTWNNAIDVGAYETGLTITTTSLPDWTVNYPYSASAIQVTHGTAPITFSVSSGTLPAGLTLNASTGVISGTPTATGAKTFTIKATDSSSPTAQTTTQSYTITINSAVSVTTTSLSDWTVNQPGYSQTVSATGGTGTLTFSVSSGTLTPGLSLSSGGALTGTPTTAGTYNFTVTATDSVGASGSHAYTVTINGPVSISPTTLPDWTVNRGGYSQTLTGSGGTGTLTFALTSGTLPPGMNFNAGSHTLSGTPNTVGSYTFTITATDTTGASSSQTYTVTIDASPSIATTALPNWTINQAYSQGLVVTGGTAPFTFIKSAGTLPTGLSVSSDGTISGTPTATGTYNFTIKVTDNASAAATQAYTVVINAAPSITTASLPSWTAGVAYSQAITTSNGTSPFIFTVSSGSVPAGLTLSSAGVLSGTPTTAGTSTFTVTATDTAGATASKTYTVTINAALALSPTSLGPWTINQAYSQTVTSTGGTGSVTWSRSGTLPTGLTFNTSTGVLSGTPTATGTSTFTITATDSIGATASQTYSFTVNAAPSITTASLPSWTAGVAYSQTIATSNGTSPFTFSVSSGTLPAGLTLSGVGVLSGTPTTAATASFTITATDAAGAAASHAYTLTINAAISVTTGSLPSWTVNRAYSQTIAASGGTGALTFAVSSGSLPAGLTLSGAGVVSGTPTATGTSTFTVTATDTVGATASQSYTVTVNAAPSITTASLPSWTINRAYSQTIATSNGTGPFTFGVTSGSLPAGLTLSGAGVVSGTPTATGASTFTVTATDAAGATAAKTYTVTINAALAITTGSLPSWTANLAYSQSIATSGGTSPLAFAVSSGSLPAGLSLSGAGVVSGTPTAAGTSTFTVTATDTAGATDSKTYTLTIDAAVSVTTGSLPNWTVNRAYSQTIATSGGTGALTFAVSSGSLPAGLTLSSAGVVSGTPTATGTSTFTVNATDSVGSSASQSYTVTVNAAPSISTASLPSWTINRAYSQTIATSNGTGPFTFAVSSGALPAGLTLSGAGVVSGTPTAAGTATFTVTATDAAGATASQSYTLTVNAALAITTASLPDWTINQAYSQSIATSGGTSPITFSVSSGTLPAALSLSAAGVVSGTPTAAGTSTFTVTATDTAGATVSKTYTVTINAAPAVTTSSLPSWTANLAYSQTIATSGGTNPFTFTISSGSLPAGLSLSAAGVVSGTPTVTGTATFTVTATDAAGATASHAYTVTIDAAVAVTTGSLPSWTVNRAYSQTIAASGGTGSLTFSVSSGSLPAGLTLSSAGVVSGTPTATGTATFTVTATDTVGASASQSYTVTVNAAPSISTASLPSWTVSRAYSQTIAASNGTGPFTFAVSSGALPAGLTLSGAGVVSGTPTATGTSTFTVTTTDAAGATASQSYTVTVNAALAITTGSLPSWTANLAYSQTIATSGGTSPLAFAVSSGTLPAGLSLSGAGAVSGTPTTAGTATFTVTATDAAGATASQSYTLTISAAPAITTASLPAWTVGQPYSQAIAASGGTGALTFSVSGGSLPAGLTLSAAGVLSGTPTTSGTASFTVTVTDSVGASASQGYTLTVNAAPAITTSSLSNWTVNRPYSQAIASTGGTSPTAFSVTGGSLPAGLTLSAAGVLSGTPTAAGTASFTVTLTDAAGATATQSYVLTINAAPAITTTSLPDWTVNRAYDQAIATSGGTAALTFSVSAGSLPAGMSLSGAGLLSGTPTAAGTTSFTVTVTDAAGATASQTYTLTVNAAPAITTASVPSWTISQPYSQAIATSGGTGSLSFSVSSGTLPAGLMLSSAGVLSGTPTATGSASFTITATDAVGATASQSYTLAVNPAPVITTTSLPAWTVGRSSSQTLAVSGGTGTLTFAVSAGSLPAGLTLSSAGVLSGSPTTAGTASFTVTVTDVAGATASQDYTLAVNRAPNIITASLPDWTVARAYGQAVLANDGTGTLTFSVSSGTLPSGLSLSGAGELSGTPSATGTFVFTITVTDAVGATDSHAYTLVINPAPTFATASLLSWTLNRPYSTTLAISGGTGAMDFEIVSGALPAGLTLSSAGVISGTPTALGTASFTLSVTDAAGATATQAYTLTINPAPAVTTASLPDWTAGQPYSQTISAASGTGPLTFSVSAGSLPAGLTLSSAGVLSGTPVTAGTSTFTVTVTDAAGATATQDYTLTINAAPAITTASLPDWTINRAYSDALASSGGTGGLTFSLSSGALPAGLTLSGAGQISGTPTGAGTVTLTITATDAVGATASRAFTLTIDPVPAFTGTSLPEWTINRPYDEPLTADGGTGTLTFSLTAGALPAGLTLLGDGEITGMPTATGSASFIVTLTDTAGATATQGYTFTVNPAPVISTASLPDWTVNRAYGATLAADGGTDPLTFTVTSGSLPAGLALSAAGVLSGTPTSTGTATFTITLSDVAGATDSESYSVTINPAPAITTASLPPWTVSRAYGQIITGDGGTGALTYSIASGSLPAGLTLSGAGLVGGTPTAAGTASFTVTATDAAGATATESYTLTINAAPVIATASLGAWTVNEPGYDQNLATSGGTGAFTFSVSGGTLPAGLTLSGTGELSGTPTAAGTVSFTITTTDAAGATATQAYTVTINAEPVIITPFLPDWTVGRVYDETLAAGGGTGGLTYTLTSGTLPAGLTLSGAGVVSGTPTTTGSSTFTVTATDATGATATHSYTLTINSAPSPTSTSLPSWTIGQPYTQTISASGGTGTLTFTVTGGTLPAGLTLSTDGVLSGTPTATGLASFTVTVTDQTGAGASQDYDLTINPAPVITTASLGAWTVSRPGYSAALAVSGGTATLTFAVSAGSLPAGMTLSSDGQLSGTPTAAGTASFTVTATDAAGAIASQSYTLTVNSDPSFVTTTLPGWTVNRGYSAALSVNGGTAALTFAVTSGSLPAGLSLSSSGQLSGTPTAIGTASFRVTVTDAAGATASQDYTLTINPTPSIVTGSLPDWTVNRAYNQTLKTSDGTGTLTFAVSAGSLPAGLTLSSDGQLSGTPTTAGTVSFTVSVTDAAGATASYGYTLTINPPPAITTASLPGWTVGRSYGQILAAGGGTGTLTFSVIGGSLPAGLTLSSAGLLSGTPTASGTASFTVTITDAAGATASRAYTLTINPAPAITTTSLPDWTVNRGYGQALAAGGGTGALTFSVTGGSLPAGLTLSSAGLLSGTPTATGAATFTVSVTDAAGATASQDYTLTINPAPAVITTSLPGATVNRPYSQTITGQGGTGGLAFSVTGGSLPAGLTLSAAGLLSGTPTAVGTASFTIAVTDAAGVTATQDYTLTVSPVPSFTTGALPAWTVTQPGYSQAITATGGTGALTFSVTGGSLPVGLTLSSAGLLTGTPTTAGTASFTITVTDAVGASATQDYSLAINPAPSFITTSVPQWTLNRAYYSAALSAGGGTGALTFSITGGSLPAGLTLSSAGQLSGTPAALGTAAFTVTITDTTGATASQSYTLTVNPVPALVTSGLPNWTVGQPYNQGLTSAGGTGTLTYAVTSGALPAGLTLSADGVLSGTPTAAGTASFTVTVIDAVGAEGSQSYAVTVNPAPAISTASLPNWTINRPYSQTLGAGGGTGTLTFSVSAGSLPAGLTLSGDGQLSGTPTAAGTVSFTISVTDAAGATASQDYTLTVNPAPAFGTASLPSWTVNRAYGQELTVNGGTGPLTFSISGGVLPAGLTLSADGEFSGTPTAVGSASFTVTVTDAAGATASQDYTLTINPAPSITTGPFAGWTVNRPFSQVFSTSGGTGTLTYVVTSGALPAGLSLSAAGVLSGTPTAAGTASFTVTVTDAAGAAATQSYDLTINPAPVISTGSPPAWTVNQAGYSESLAAGGGTGALTFAISGGSLPAGLTLSGAGVLSGTPTTAGAASFTVTVTDAAGASASQDYTLTINPAPAVTTPSLPDWTVGRTYSQIVSGNGGTGTLTYAVTGGALPAGLTLSGAGVLSGIPTTPGTVSFTVSVTDATGACASQSYTVTINVVPAVTTTSLPDWTINRPYNAALAATGGTGALSFSLSGGALPAGLSLSSDGQLTGTPTAAGTASFTVTVTDTAGATGTQSYTVTINPAPAISTASLPSWTIGRPYGQALAAGGGTGALTYSLTGGALPAGLTLSGAGALSGTPTGVGTALFTVTVTDVAGATASQTYTLTVNPTPVLNTGSLPDWTVNRPYSATLAASAGTGTLTFAITAGALPVSLSLSSDGQLTGTPTATGAASFSVTVTDAAGATATQNYTVAINPAPTIGTAAFPAWTVNRPYSQTVAASGGTGTLAFSVSGGSLPAGLSLSSDGQLSGTPAATGTATFTIAVTDAAGSTASQTYGLTIDPAPVLTTSSLPDWTVNRPYSTMLTAGGGTGTLAFSVSGGSLPAGLTLSSDGQLSGTPTTAGTASFTVTVTDAAGATATQDYTLAINAAPVINTATLADWTAARPYSQTVSAGGGTGTLTFAVGSGALPPGLTLSAGGVLSGTPTTVGSSTFTVTVTDAAGAIASQSYTLTINAAPTITTSALPAWTVNRAYSAAVAAVGGTGTLVFSVSAGAVPAGLSLSHAGQLTGTPTATGTSSFTVTVTDAAGVTDSRSYTLTVNATPVITTASLPAWTVSRPYSQAISAGAGTGVLAFSVTSGALPAGLTLSPAGVLSGTPTAAGTASFTVTVTDSAGAIAVQGYTLTINPAPSISMTSLPDWTVDEPGYGATLAAGAGTGALTFTVTGGTLPPGLTLSGTGALSGTPTDVGTATFSVTVNDAAGATASQSYTLTIDPTPGITTTALPPWTLNRAYSEAVLADGGTGALTFTLVSGSLPPGLSLSAAGLLSGTPTTAGTASFTVAASDATGAVTSHAYTLTINPAPAFTSGVLPAWTVSEPGYDAVLSATGGTGALTFRVSYGSLPAGLTLSTDGQISGTPAATGFASFIITATDAAGAQATEAYTLTVDPAPELITPFLPPWTVNRPYNEVLTADGGTGALTFTVTSGTLPAGLSLSDTGVLDGTPTAPDTASLAITVTDATGASASHSYTLIINPAPTAAAIFLPSWTVGQPYSQAIPANGGTGILTFSVTGGSLPAGLTLSSDGLLSGTPTAPGTASFTVSVTDQTGATTSQDYAVTINPAPVLTTSSLPGWTTGRPYTQSLSASGGTGTLTFAVSNGALPAGLTLSSDGLLSGTPTGVGTSFFTVTVTDTTGATDSRAYTLTINAAPTFATSSLPAWTVNQAYGTALVANAGTGELTFAVTSGAIPPGLAFSGAGQISGTPTATGTWDFTVTLTDAAGATDSRSYALTINPAPVIATVSLPAWTAGRPYSQTLTADAGTGTPVFALTSGALPAGLTLSPGGQISGTPTAPGVASFTVTVTDAAGATASRSYTLTVNPVPSFDTASLPAWTVNRPYSQAIAVSGGTGGLTFGISGGSLPAGLTLSADGQISGTPTAPGAVSFLVTVTDATGATATHAYALTINPAPSFSTASLPSWTINRAYGQVLAANGGTGALTFALTRGAPPAGLTLSGAGILSGTPTAPGSASFTVTVTDTAGASASRDYVLTISPAPSLGTSSLPDWTVYRPYSQALTATGGVGVLTYSLSSGTLPAGLSLSADGLLTGTPWATGSASFTVTVTDAAGATADQAYTLSVNPAPRFAISSLPRWTVGQPYSQALTANGGTAALTFRVSNGSLPAGLTLSADGAISGTPTAPGSSSFSIIVTDAAGATATRRFSLAIDPGPDITTDRLPDWTINQPGYSESLAADGGTGALTFHVSSGTLPAGLTLSEAGNLSGTPTTVGASSFTVSVTDATGAAASHTYTFLVDPEPVLITAHLPAGSVGTASDEWLQVSGGTGPLTFTITSGSLPPGLSLSRTGRLSGTPETSGTSAFAVTVTDAAGVTNTRDYVLSVNQQPRVRINPRPRVVINPRTRVVVNPRTRVVVNPRPRITVTREDGTSAWGDAKRGAAGTEGSLAAAILRDSGDEAADAGFPADPPWHPDKAPLTPDAGGDVGAFPWTPPPAAVAPDAAADAGWLRRSTFDDLPPENGHYPSTQDLLAVLLFLQFCLNISSPPPFYLAQPAPPERSAAPRRRPRGRSPAAG